MSDHYFLHHVRRLVKATNDLWMDENSICTKCHDMDGHLNCLLCYCPRYDETDCGGDFIILKNGNKDCSDCIKPHDPMFVEEFLKRKLKSGDE